MKSTDATTLVKDANGPRVFAVFAGMHRTVQSDMPGAVIMDSPVFDRLHHGTDLYIDVIKQMLDDNPDTKLLVSAHAELREAMAKESIRYAIILPEAKALESLRAVCEGYVLDAWLGDIGKQWDAWQASLRSDKNCEYITNIPDSSYSYDTSRLSLPHSSR